MHRGLTASTRMNKLAYGTFMSESESARRTLEPGARKRANGSRRWPRGKLRATWRAAKAGDESARLSLIEHLRHQALLRARHFRRLHPEADMDELISIVEVALVEVVDKELQRPEPRPRFLAYLVQNRLAFEYQRALRPVVNSQADPYRAFSRSNGARAAAFLRALKLKRDDVVTFDLDKWHAALKRLKPRDRKILLARHDFITWKPPATFRDLGPRLGLSYERVRQLEERALKRLRERALADGLISCSAVAKAA